MRVAITRPMLLVAGGVTLPAGGLVRDLARLALEARPAATTPDRHPDEALGALVLVLAAVAALGAVARNLVVAVRREPAHRNVAFWS